MSSLTKDEINAFQTFVIVLTMLLVIALIIIIIAQIRFLLNPITLLKSSLADVIDGKDTSIKGKFFSEITPLVDELNKLFDYSVKLIDRHRTFANNLAHSIKTPLSVIRNHDKSELVNEQVKIIELIINRNLARLRIAGGNNLLSARTEIGPIISVIGKNYGKLYQKEIEQNLEENCFFKGDESDLYEVIGNIVENACKFAKSKVRLTLKSSDKNEIIIEDDGKGIDFNKINLDLFSRGTRLDENVAGTGIGLTLTKEIIDIYEGSIELTPSELGGLKVVIRFEKG
jgi:signal transduction histidine kinase